MALFEGHKNENCPNKFYKEKDSHFYKIIVSPSTQSYKIRIPPDYVKTYERQQLKEGYIKLRVPDSKVWRVELSKESGNVWLTKGWEVFYKSYGLDYGYFLLFRYDKVEYEFHITIFDTTSCQIDYDLVFHNYMETPPKSEVSSRVEDTDLSDCSGDLITDEGLGVQDETIFNTSVNPRFAVQMSYNKVSNRYEMTLPYAHVREHLKPEIKHKDLIWITPDDKRYVVRLHVTMKRFIARLNCAGWRKFVQENELKTGDTCAFELVDPESYMYKVTIFRASKYNN